MCLHTRIKQPRSTLASHPHLQQQSREGCRAHSYTQRSDALAAHLVARHVEGLAAARGEGEHIARQLAAWLTGGHPSGSWHRHEA